MDRTHKAAVDRALKHPKTKTGYERSIRLWLQFCAFGRIDHLDGSARTQCRFVSYVRDHTLDTAGVAGSHFLGVAHHFARNASNFTFCGAARKALKGLASERPSKRYPKMPWSILHFIRILSMEVMDFDLWIDKVIWTCMLTYHAFGLRGGEGVEYTRTKPRKALRASDIKFEWVEGQLKQASVDLKNHKGDPDGLRNAVVSSPCICHNDPRLCTPHALWHYTQWRKAKFPDREELFIRPDGKRLIHGDLKLAMQNLIVTINIMCGLNLKVKQYKPHSFRSGGVVDRLRGGASIADVQAWGRWSPLSKTWNSSYAKINPGELTDVSGRTLASLNWGANIDGMMEAARSLSSNPLAPNRFKKSTNPERPSSAPSLRRSASSQSEQLLHSESSSSTIMEAFQAEECASEAASDGEESEQENLQDTPESLMKAIVAVDLEYDPEKDERLISEIDSIRRTLGITEGPGTGKLYFFPSRIHVYRTIQRLVTQFRGNPRGLEEELVGKRSNWCRDIRANIRGSMWRGKGYSLKVMIPLLMERFIELGVSKP